MACRAGAETLTFAPATLPFPLLHIESGWDFREVIEFRDRTAREFGLDLRVQFNEQARRDGVTPFTHGSSYADLMLTTALKQGLDYPYACRQGNCSSCKTIRKWSTLPPNRFFRPS